jgi:hypothetical protein
MLRYHLDVVFTCFGAFWIFFLAIGFTVYKANAHRPANDPKKRNIHPFAVLLVPLVIILSIPLTITIFIFATTLFTAFIPLFAILLVAFRLPFLFVWWRRLATFVGEPLLRIIT